ncbi:hypothetical protein C7B82_25075, partial [Stenomitos frigidus ULC18]
MQGRVVKGPPKATAAETLFGEKTGVGIDVCPARLDVYLRPQGPTLKVPPTEAGVRTLLGQRQPTPPPRVVAAATGGWDELEGAAKQRRSRAAPTVRADSEDHLQALAPRLDALKPQMQALAHQQADW